VNKAGQLRYLAHAVGYAALERAEAHAQLPDFSKNKYWRCHVPPLYLLSSSAQQSSSSSSSSSVENNNFDENSDEYYLYRWEREILRIVPAVPNPELWDCSLMVEYGFDNSVALIRTHTEYLTENMCQVGMTSFNCKSDKNLLTDWQIDWQNLQKKIPGLQKFFFQNKLARNYGNIREPTNTTIISPTTSSSSPSTIGTSSSSTSATGTTTIDTAAEMDPNGGKIDVRGDWLRHVHQLITNMDTLVFAFFFFVSLFFE